MQTGPHLMLDCRRRKLIQSISIDSIYRLGEIKLRSGGGVGNSIRSVAKYRDEKLPQESWIDNIFAVKKYEYRVSC